MSDMSAKRAGEIVGNEGPIEKEFDCPKHGKYTGTSIKKFGITMDTMCPECEKERAIEEAELEKQRQAFFAKAKEEAENEAREKRFIEMNIGKKFWGESFDTFDPYTEGLKKHLETCKAYANDHQGRMLLMIGKNGNGKNHLATSILKVTGGCIYSVFEIELMLKECYSGKDSEPELFRRLCDIPMLIINEIGRHKSGDWETNFLSYIINKRYENLMPTVLITNTHLLKNCPTDPKKGCPSCLQRFLGNDVLSRIVEDGEVMSFNEEDYRYKKREMRKKEKHE